MGLYWYARRGETFLRRATHFALRKAMREHDRRVLREAGR